VHILLINYIFVNKSENEKGKFNYLQNEDIIKVILANIIKIKDANYLQS